MKKTLIFLTAVAVILTAFCVVVSAGDISFRGYEIKSVSPSGYARTDFSPNITASGESSTLKRASLPSKYDSREKGVITSIKDQGMHGACWAFSAISCAETSLIKFYPDQFTLENTDLSEVQHAYFTYSAVDDALNMCEDKNIINKSNFLDLGGNMYGSTFIFAKWFGAADEKSVTSYEDAEPKMKLPDSKAYDSNVAVLENAYWISPSNHRQMKEMIMKYGSVSTSCLYDYSIYNQKNNALYCSLDTYGNHQITIIGWDDNFSRKNFGLESLFGTLTLPINRPSKNGAWLVKNSYGPADGEDGCFWLSYYDKAMLNDEACAYAFRPVRENESNYQYDGSINVGNFFSDGEKLFGANVFTSNGAEKLKAISFISDDDEQTYSYQIYLNPKSGKPTSGTAVYSTYQPANVEYCGYNTIELKEPVQLAKGTRFSVVLKAVNKGKTAGIVTDFSGDVDIDGYTSSKTTVRKGQSFISEDGKKWEDVTKYKDGDNIRLKAITEKGRIAPKSLSAETVRIENGKKVKLAVESKPAFASKAYKYTVSDSSVAAVSSNGEITAKKIGKCVVTVTSKVDPSVKTKVTVKVLPAAVSSVETVYASKKAVNIKWSSVEGAAGYEVYILRGGEKKLLFTTGKTSGKVSGLASKTEYTIFVRAYADVGSAKYRSAYCKAVIKTK